MTKMLISAALIGNVITASGESHSVYSVKCCFEMLVLDYILCCMLSELELQAN